MKKTIICNQKMFLSLKDSIKLRDEMLTLDLFKVDFIVCPSYLDFDLYKDFEICSQDCFYEDNGPYTAEVSASNLKERGINYSLVGHSYRRDHDSDYIINLKVLSILKNNMTPVLCVGETKKDFDFGNSKEVLVHQLKADLKNVSLSSDQQIIIAYEPVWAIGSGHTLTNEILNKTLKIIKDTVDKMNISNYKVLYGGSVSDKNIKCIISCDVDGCLLGNSSINIKELSNIIKCINM